MSGSLFEQVGGTPAITALIDTFYAKLVASPASGPFFEGKDVAYVKAKQVEFFSNGLGSGTPYTGRGMLAIHTGLAITEAEFSAVAGMLSDSLRELNVSEEIYNAVMAFAGAQKDEIVGH